MANRKLTQIAFICILGLLVVLLTGAASAAEWNSAAAATITLEGSTATATDGAGIEIEGSTVTITSGGTYVLSGTLMGSIVVAAPDTDDVQLVLGGVDITASVNAAIYCSTADTLTVTLAEGTVNTLTDASVFTYADEAAEEPDAALFSKVDLTLGGAGSLTVNGNFHHGISSKDDLVIEGGSYAIRAAGHAIRGKDSLTIVDGNFTIEADGDGLQASNADQADRGWISLAGGMYTIRAGGDGIQAETDLSIHGGTYDILTSGAPPVDSTSQKGIKAGANLVIDGGTFQIDSVDDGVHANGDVQIDGGDFTILTGDDGIHADRQLRINGGNINVPTCYEGFEGTTVLISGGKSFIQSIDDAVSAAAGTDDVPTDGARGRANPNVYARITGGELEAVSGGDTIDANGFIFIEGGTIRLSSPPRPSYEGALLCNGDVTFTGGNVALVGNVGVGVIAESQPLLLVSHPADQPEGSVVSLRDQSGNTLLEVVSLKPYIQSAFTSPELQIGSTYGIYIDGEKRTDITLRETITRTGDDGGEFTGGYTRGQW